MSPRLDATFDAVEQIRDRLAATVEGLKSVESVLEAARNRQPNLPAAIVYPVADQAAGNLGGRARALQKMSGLIAVLHVIGAPNDPRGANARAELGRIVAATRGELLGWTPGGADAPLQLNPGRSGRLEEIAGGQVYWSDTYLMPWTLSTKP